MKPFRYATKNKWGDCLEAEQSMHQDGTIVLRLEDRDGDRQCAILTRADLTAIIAGLTAIRDAMPEGE